MFCTQAATGSRALLWPGVPAAVHRLACPVRPCLQAVLGCFAPPPAGHVADGAVAIGGMGR